MAESGAGGDELPMDLNVHCNATIAPIRFPDLPASTTVGELKSRVHDALDSKPPVERMRLIYRGRIIPNDAEQLANIFGRENIKESRQQSIHLVISDHGSRPLANETSSWSTTSTSSSASLPRPASIPPTSLPQNTNTPTNPFRPPNAVPPGRPHSQPPLHPPRVFVPGVPPPHHHHHPPPGFGFMMANVPPAPGMAPMGPMPPPQLPPDIGNMINRQLQTAMQQAQAHAQQHFGQQGGQTSGNQQPPPGQETRVNVPTAGGIVPGPMQPPNVFQHGNAQPQPQPQQEPPTGSHSAGPGNADARPTANGHDSGSRGTASPSNNANGDAVFREGTGPNGARWSFSIDSTVRVPGQPGQPGHSTQPPFPPFLPGPFPLHLHRPVQPPAPRWEELNALLASARRTAQEIEELTRAIPSSNTADERRVFESARLNYLRNRAQAVVNNLNDIQARLSPEMQSIQQNIGSLRLMQQNVVSQLDRLAQPPRSSLLDSAAPTNHSQAAVPSDSSSRTSTVPPLTQPRSSTTLNYNDASLPAEVYLLSGPEGPYGLVFSNRGTYTTAPFVQRSTGTSAPTVESTMQRLRDLREQMENHTQRLLAQAGEPLGVRQQGNLPDPHPVPGQDQQNPAQQRQMAQPGQEQGQQDLQNIARPAALLGHIWLAVRLLFFMYMLSGGSSWRRPLMIGGIAVVIYLNRLGLFNNQIDRARRHFENLLPLPEERRREQEQQRAAGQGEPSPQQTAQRLIREHENQTWTRIRDSLQLVERGVALFVASLWPGLGERMIATREERLRQQREQEEQRQQEEQRRQDEEAARRATEAETNEEKEGESPVPREHGEASGISSTEKGKGKAKDEVEINDPAGPSQASLDKADGPAQAAQARLVDVD